MEPYSECNTTVVLSIYFHITDLSFQPSVQFPKSLLKLSENTTISMLSAYLTVPTLPTEKDSNFFTLNLSGKGGKMNLKNLNSCRVIPYHI